MILNITGLGLGSLMKTSTWKWLYVCESRSGGLAGMTKQMSERPATDLNEDLTTETPKLENKERIHT